MSTTGGCTAVAVERGVSVLVVARSVGTDRADRAGAGCGTRGPGAAAAVALRAVSFGVMSLGGGALVVTVSAAAAGVDAGVESGDAADSSAGVASEAADAAGAVSGDTLVEDTVGPLWLRRATRNAADPIETTSAAAAAAKKRDLDDITDLPDRRALPKATTPR